MDYQTLQVDVDLSAPGIKAVIPVQQYTHATVAVIHQSYSSTSAELAIRRAFAPQATPVDFSPAEAADMDGAPVTIDVTDSPYIVIEADTAGSAGHTATVVVYLNDSEHTGHL